VVDENGVTNAQAAIRWLIDLPRFATVPIIGARTLNQLNENHGEVDITLSTNQFDCIATARYDEDSKCCGYSHWRPWVFRAQFS
jgi:aryl-alcohol dehydrogenase-like predicted oxidoreductase